MPPESPEQPAPGINTWNENQLHATLKTWYAGPTARFEVPVENYVIDIVENDTLIEIQTRHFHAMKRKLAKLTPNYPVRVVYPVSVNKWIVKMDLETGEVLDRRKSPRRGTVEDLFLELVRLPHLLAHPNFSLDVLLIHEEEIRVYDGKRGWRRKGWVTHERRLIDVIDHQLFKEPADLAVLIPAALEEPFTTGDLAKAIKRPRRIAQKMAYCLRELTLIEMDGKKGNAYLYKRSRHVEPNQ